MQLETVFIRVGQWGAWLFYQAYGRGQIAIEYIMTMFNKYQGERFYAYVEGITCEVKHGGNNQDTPDARRWVEIVRSARIDGDWREWNRLCVEHRIKQLEAEIRNLRVQISIATGGAA